MESENGDTLMVGKIPEHLKAAIDRHVSDGAPTGAFLRAVLDNSLWQAVGLADDINIRLLPEIVSYLYNDCPAQCWGSPERVQSWRAARHREAEQRRMDAEEGIAKDSI